MFFQTEAHMRHGHRLQTRLIQAFSPVALALALACGGGGGGGTGSSGGSNTTAVQAVPQGFIAIGAASQVVLTWNASPGATSYKVKRGNHGGPYSLLDGPTVTHYTDSGRANGTTYYYVISAVGPNGESADSSEVSATPSAGLPVLPAEDSTKNHIGLNTWFLNDWDNGFAFVDAMTHARAWQDGANWNNPVAGIDAQGWPTADASTVILSGTPAQLNGTYRLVFNGQADISCLFFSSAATVSNKSYNAGTNTTTADVTFNYSASSPMGLIFRNTKRTANSASNTGFTNAHLYRPGYPTDGSVVFATPYLNALGKTTAVRMMDCTATNGNLTQHWSQRMTPLGTARPGPS